MAFEGCAVRVIIDQQISPLAKIESAPERGKNLSLRQNRKKPFSDEEKGL